MDTDRPAGFECTACGAELPSGTVEYDDLGYPICPECRTVTGPLGSVETDDPTGVAD